MRNVGVLHAKGKWIAFIDADEIADLNWIKELMEKTSNFNIIMGSVETMNPNVNGITKFFDLLHTDRKMYLKKGKNLKTIGTGNLLVNREVFNSGIMFDNNFPTSEDGDFSYRLYREGFKFGYTEKAKIYHKIPETVKQLIYFLKKMIIGKLLIFNKHRNLETLMRIIQDIFYFLSPNYFYVYKKNEVLPKTKFLFLGLVSFVISIYYCINPFNVFKLKKKIHRPK